MRNITKYRLAVVTILLIINSSHSFSQLVGVGITTPLAPLHVKSTTYSDVLRVEALTPRISFWNIGTPDGGGSVWAKNTGMDISSHMPISGIALPVTISPGLLTSTTFLANGNVGIGTATPQAKLEVRNPVNSIIKIRSENYIDTARLIFSNRNNAEQGTDFIFSSNSETGLNILTSSDIPANNTASILFLSPQGNVGIGNNSPANKLEVNGNINVTGLLKINSSSGIAGQVLVSNGAAPATWQNSALSNNTRFSVTMTTVSAGSGNMPFTTRYNLNPANVTIGANSITINQAGLYHFEGHLTAYVFVAAPTSSPYVGISLSTTSGLYEFIRADNIPATGSGFYGSNIKFSIDLYFNAFQTLTLPYIFFSGGGSSNSLDGWFTGYLISN